MPRLYIALPHLEQKDPLTFSVTGFQSLEKEILIPFIYYLDFHALLILLLSLKEVLQFLSMGKDVVEWETPLVQQFLKDPLIASLGDKYK
jgi:hypothetical protein|tara:strand:- start:3014 stop:3283 length:270 start_codon:yes stop_codon:yes gene_type:complete